MKKLFVFSILVWAGTLLFVACKKNTDDPNKDILVQNPNLPATLLNYANPTLPAHFNIPPVQQQDNTPSTNPITNAGATLGRVLFYDKNLSINNTIACASCHKQSDGFADTRQFSVGFEGGTTPRNSMGLSNARYYQRGAFFWDERAANLETQVLMPIQDHTEMGMTLEGLLDKVGRISYYPALFQNAFGNSEVTSDKISKALAQFIRAMVSANSKYDAGRATLGNNPITTNFSNFTAEENLGKSIFFDPAKGNCASCHGSENFVANNIFNNGLDVSSADNGVGKITSNPQQNGLFKINSLRNIEKTAPYMHDGRFTTLEQVVEHYNSGVKAHPNLSPQLRQPGTNIPKVLNLTNGEKAALVAFLKTLTDNSFLQDTRFSNPF